MLVLSRKLGEKILIGSDICVTVVSVKGNRVTLGIEAPKHVRIDRSELVSQTASEPAAIPSTHLIDRIATDSLSPSVAG